MKILHVILDDNVKKYLTHIQSLEKNAPQTAEHVVVTDRQVDIDMKVHLLKPKKWNIFSIRNKFLHILYTEMPDMVHVHGGWSYAQYQCLKMSANRGFITYYSPYGEISSKTIKTNLWKEKIWKCIWYQRPMVRCADHVFSHSKKETEFLKLFGGKKHIFQLDEAEKTKQIHTRYREDYETKAVKEIDLRTMASVHRQLHAVLNGLPAPEIELTPRWQQQYEIFCRRHGLSEIITNNQVPRYTEEDSVNIIVSLIKELKMNLERGKATFGDVFSLCTIMQNNEYDEDEVCKQLHNSSLYNFTRRIVQIGDELCGIEPGYLPVLALNDESTIDLKKDFI